MEPETKADLPSHRADVQVEEATRVRVEVPTSGTHVAPERDATERVATVVQTAPKPVPAADWLGVGAIATGLFLIALGLLFFGGGLMFALDHYVNEMDAAVTFMFLGTMMGVVPGAITTALGAQRVSHHAQLRRLVAVAKGNDFLDVPTLARLLEVNEKTARKLAVDALTRRLLDARFDAQADRLVLKPSTSPFR